MSFSNIHKSFILKFLNLVIVCLFSFSIAACSGEEGNYDSGSTLINCKTCNGKVSKNALDCPHCGERSPDAGESLVRPSADPLMAKIQAQLISNMMTMYMLDMGLSSLADDFDLEFLLLSPHDGGGPSGPYLERENLVDPWGNPFKIEIPSTVNVNYSFDIISWGEDGKPGGEGENEDVTQ
jgi:hypothetical protein